MAIGVSERFMRQQFDKWWKDPEGGVKYHRLSTSKLENLKSLKNPLSVFDPNGDFVIEDVDFRVINGLIAVDIDAKKKVDKFWDPDVDISLTVGLEFRNGELVLDITVVDVDIDFPFLVDLLFVIVGIISGVVGVLIGIIIGVIVGHLAGSFVGGIVGGALFGAAVGAGFGAIVPFVILKIVEKAKEKKIDAAFDEPLVLGIPSPQWQIPGTSLGVKGKAVDINLKTGEALLFGTAEIKVLNLSESQWLEPFLETIMDSGSKPQWLEPFLQSTMNSTLVQYSLG